jgi:hypothetical protein
MFKTKAQSLSEYTICLAGLLLAMVAMQVYVKRGLQGRYSDVVRHTTAQVNTSGKNQYEPYYRSEDFNNTEGANILENIQPQGIYNKTITVDRTTREGMSQEQINCYDDK